MVCDCALQKRCTSKPAPTESQPSRMRSKPTPLAQYTVRALEPASEWAATIAPKVCRDESALAAAQEWAREHGPGLVKLELLGDHYGFNVSFKRWVRVDRQGVGEVVFFECK